MRPTTRPLPECLAHGHTQEKITDPRRQDGATWCTFCHWFYERRTKEEPKP